MAVHHFPPKYTGGAELRTYRTASQMEARGYGVQVICVEHDHQGPTDGVAWEADAYDGIPVHRLSFDLSGAPNPFLWEYDNAWIGEHLSQYLEESRPDVFHLIGGYLMSGRALRAAQESGIPTVVTLTDFWFLCPRVQMWRSNGALCPTVPKAEVCARCLGEERRRYRLPARIAPGLMKAFWRVRRGSAHRIEARRTFLLETLNRTDRIISPSRFLRRCFIEAGVNPDKIVFVRQGRDFPDLHPEDLTKTASPYLRVGYIGQIVRHKGVHILFEAVRHLPGAAIQVRAYGDTSHFPRYAAELGQQAGDDGRLSLDGNFPREALSRVLRELDVIVVPSLWYENSPNVILEAFAHRTPVIASNVGGMAELVEHGVNGLHFQIGDSRDLARQLRRIIDEPTLLGTLRRGIPPVKTAGEEMDELAQTYNLVA
jgi:glycosyltransferase involved in cell wall biosynthesis